MESLSGLTKAPSGVETADNDEVPADGVWMAYPPPMAWDDDTRDAWRSAYASVSLAMQRGLRQER